MWRNTVTLDCAWKGETWKKWWVILLWFHCATRCHCSFYQHNIGKKKWNIPKLFFSLLFYHDVVEEGVSSFQHSDLWAGVTMHPWTHLDVLFLNWFLWASAAAWWILKLESIHSSFSVATKYNLTKCYNIYYFPLGPQFSVWVLLFHLGLCWRAGEEQDENGSIPASRALQGQQSAWLLTEWSQRWRENLPLLIIHWSYWLWSEAAAADSICSHFPWTVREVNRAKSLLPCHSVVHKQALLVFSLLSLWESLLGVSFLTFPAH